MTTPINLVYSSVLPKTMSFLTRAPGLLGNACVFMMAGELAIRAATSIIEGIGFNLSKKDSWAEWASKQINSSGIRPYKYKELIGINKISGKPEVISRENATLPLLYKTVQMVALTILFTELATFLCGPVPTDIYNTVLPYFGGPIRLGTDSFFDTGLAKAAMSYFKG